jgi:predicted nuclease of predicted toxin-antitoxin system
MTIQILVDMNLSPDWVPFLNGHGWSAAHWSTVGDPRAPDRAIMGWALANGYIVFTHDLDFGTALALTHAAGPSVLQVRTQDVLPQRLGSLVVATLRDHEAELAAGALVVIDEARSRLRILPF